MHDEYIQVASCHLGLQPAHPRRVAAGVSDQQGVGHAAVGAGGANATRQVLQALHGEGIQDRDAGPDVSGDFEVRREGYDGRGERE